MQAEKACHQLSPIAEQPAHQSAASSCPADGVQTRQHTNRPSRLSALLPPGSSPGPTSHSPPPSPPAASQRAVTVLAVPNSEIMCKAERQVCYYISCMSSANLQCRHFSGQKHTAMSANICQLASRQPPGFMEPYSQFFQVHLLCT